MKHKEAIIYGISSKSEFLAKLGITEQEFQNAISAPYQKYAIMVNDKIRIIEAPNVSTKQILKKLLLIFQQIERPEYCQCCWKGTSNIQNAKVHIGNQSTITLDIANYFISTGAKYVEDFFRNQLKISGEALNILMQLTTVNGHIPTGSPTSPILAFWANKPIFERIYTKMKTNNIVMTLYMDDITLSAKYHIPNRFILFCKNAMKMHGLRVKNTKTKRFGYKGAWVTGVLVSQGSQMRVNWSHDFAIVKSLQAKEISAMNEKELQKLLGKISYVQQIEPERFRVTKQKVIKALKILQKEKTKTL